MKKWGLLLALVMVLGMMPTLADEDKTVSERFSCGDWEYVLLEDGTAEIVGWAGAVLTIPDTFARPEVHAEEKTLVIPGTLDDHLVTAIAASALWWDDTVTSVALPDSIVYIGKDAFWRDNGFGNLPNLTLTVPRDSYAAEYAKANNIPYTYPDANDWLTGD